MSPAVDRIPPSPTPLPTRTDVVVIGGGIAGASTALYLAEKGIAVTLCEKGEIGAEQSSRNWGWVRVMGRDPNEIPLSVASLRLWEDLDRLAGASTGFRRAGIVYTCDTAADLAAYEAWLEHARTYELSSRLLDAAALSALVPGAARTFAGALYTPDDARAEPQKAAPAIARGARAKGAAVHTRCAVRTLETAAGRVSGVVTEQGRIACSSVVIAGGAWSRLFCGNAGIDFPTLKTTGSVARTAPLPNGPDLAVGGSDFAFRRREDGGYTVARRGAMVSELTPDHFRLFFDFLPTARRERRELRLRLGERFGIEWRTKKRWRADEMTPFEEVRTLDPKPSDDLLDEGWRNLVAAWPMFKDAPLVERWGGLIDVTPDAVPVVSAVEALPGLHIASGFSGHGFGIGPGAGHLMADLVAGDAPIVDPTPFRFDRFPQGLRPLAA
jgi:glycine/D-amino acid oxidase-like deaminating enzyme